MTDTQALSDAIKAIVPELEYEAVFVPQSRSRNASDATRWLNWRVTLTTGAGMLTTDYMQGIGHLPGQPRLGPRTVDDVEVQTAASERGVYRGRPLDPPSLPDVLHSLLLDADVIDYATFEEWADDFGFDRDSRKAEATYRQCLAIALQLRSILGEDKIRQLREALADM